jgi:hypothetical protein
MIGLIESNGKCRYVKNCNVTLRQVFICLRPPPLYFSVLQQPVYFNFEPVIFMH